jgi:transcriptional regulator with XRE-family HTH domain
MMAEMNFGERLCYLRESKGWLQRDVAFRMNVKSNTISNWEKGISRPNLDQLAQLCQVLSVKADSILGLDKTGMERTLNLKEQHILTTYRNCSPEMQSAFFNFTLQLDRMNHSIFEKSAELDCAVDFINTSGLHDDWEAAKREVLSQDDPE